MSEYALHIKSGPNELFRACAARFANLIEDKPGPVSVALAGGSTPKRLYELLVDDYRHRLDWSDVDFWFGDERSVPPNDPQSNFRMAHQSLLGPLGIAEHRIHRMQGEHQDLGAAAREYEQTLRAKLAANQAGVPIFDLVLLGMGDDGHTASLFPQTVAISERDRLVTDNFVPQLDTQRLTLTYPLINAARNIMFLVSGSAKSKALAAVLEGPRDVEQFPSQGISPVAGSVEWWVDGEAASALTQRN